MFSIGILGFLVWSFFFSSMQREELVALSYREVGVTNLAVCWDSLTLLGTFSCKNLSSHTQSAGNRNFTRNTSSSETISEISCQNFRRAASLATALPRRLQPAYRSGSQSGSGCSNLIRDRRSGHELNTLFDLSAAVR